MTDEIRRRAACDRCHSQKIRCPRQPGQVACSRCVKSGSRCNFSPFRQKKNPNDDGSPGGSVPEDRVLTSPRDATRPLSTYAAPKRRRVDLEPGASEDQVTTNASQSYEPFNVDDMGLDWMQDSYPTSQDVVDPTLSHIFPLPEGTGSQGIFSLMDYDPNPIVQLRKELNLTRSLHKTSHLLPNPESRAQIIPIAPNMWIPGNPVIETASVGDCVQKLSQLSVDLYQHSLTLPPMSIHDPENADEDGAMESGLKDYSQFILEETFRLTQGLIDIYPTFLCTFLNHVPSQGSTPPFWMDTSPSESSSASPEDSGEPVIPQQPRPPLDHSSILLILSCHTRIIEIYETLFKHMDVCMRQKGIPLNSRQSNMKVPTLSIGTYTPPPSSAIPMQMLLLIQFASQLFNYAEDLALEIEGHDGGRKPVASEDTTLALTRAAAANVKDRASHMAQEIGTMRGLMLRAGILA